MTRKEMLDYMIEIGCIKVEDRNVWKRKSKKAIEWAYKTAVPVRLEYLKEKA